MTPYKHVSLIGNWIHSTKHFIGIFISHFRKDLERNALINCDCPHMKNEERNKNKYAISMAAFQIFICFLAFQQYHFSHR